MKMLLKKITAIVSAFVLIIHFNACENKDTTELFWHITQCKDPWWAENVELPSSSYRELMTNYLLTKDIMVDDHFLVQNAAAADASCADCSCETTYCIRAVFLDDDVDDALALGFKRELSSCN